MVEKSGVEKFLFALGLKSSWLKILGLKGLGLKLGVKMSGVEMSFNHLGARDDQIIRISEFFDEMRLSRSLRPLRPLRSLRLQRL